MDSKQDLKYQSMVIAIGQLVCAGVVNGVFAALGKWDITVVIGALCGAVLALGNFLVMGYFANKAADKAEAQDVAGGQKLIQLSYMGRMIGLLLIMVLLVKTGLCHVIALVLPLAFNRPTLMVGEWIRTKGGGKA